MTQHKQEAEPGTCQYNHHVGRYQCVCMGGKSMKGEGGEGGQRPKVKGLECESATGQLCEAQNSGFWDCLEVSL